MLVVHHDNVGKVIEDWEKAGWRLHNYQAVGDVGMAAAFVNHSLHCLNQKLTSLKNRVF